MMPRLTSGIPPRSVTRELPYTWPTCDVHGREVVYDTQIQAGEEPVVHLEPIPSRHLDGRHDARGVAAPAKGM